MDPVTAIFAGMPGGLSEMVVTGAAAGADIRAIGLTHTARLAIVLATVPLGIQLFADVEISGLRAGPAEAPGLDERHDRRQLAVRASHADDERISPVRLLPGGVPLPALEHRGGRRPGVKAPPLALECCYWKPAYAVSLARMLLLVHSVVVDQGYQKLPTVDLAAAAYCLLRGSPPLW